MHPILAGAQALFLDLDDTIVDSELCYANALAELNLDSALYQRARKSVKALVGPYSPSQSHRLLYFKRMLDEENKFSAEKLLSISDAYESILELEFRKAWQASSRDHFFQSLPHDISVVLVTNETTRTQLLKLRAFGGGAARIRHVVTSEEVGVSKPDVGIFRRAIECVSHPDASRVIMVGDRVEADIIPAYKLGFRPALTTEFRDESEILPEGIRPSIHILQSLMELVT